MHAVVVHPRFGSISGAELVAVHALRRLLARGASVRVVTLSEFDADVVWRASGVDLREAVASGRLRVDVRRAPVAVARFPLSGVAWLHRAARAAASRADLWMSTYNEANLGRRGLQYVHHPLFAPRALLRRYEIDDAAPGLARSAYDAATRALAGARPAAFRANETLVNSAFMAGVVREAYGIESTVLYPAFLDDATPAGGARDNVMASVGRIAPDKHTLRLLDLMAAAHARVPDLRFVVAGFATDADYYAEVRARAAALALPVRFETDLGHDGIGALLRASRYFLSAKRYEHFGITTLEALHAGALPLVHASGGSVEIVPDERLWYRTADDLAAAVARLDASQALRAEALGAATRGLDRFGAARFDAGLDAAVERTLAA